MEAFPLEGRIQEIGLRLFESAERFKRGLSKHDVDIRLMEWAMQDEKFKVQLFRFVDVLPMLIGNEELLNHLQEYLGDQELRFPLFGHFGHSGLKIAAGNKIAGPALAALVRSQITGMAKNFIAGTTLGEAMESIRRLGKQQMDFTMDILGEVTVSDAEATAYQQQYLDLLAGLARQMPTADSPTPALNISVKLSALSAQFEPADPTGTAERVKAKLRPILTLAKAHGAFVNIDMEQYAVKDVTLRIFHELIMEPEFRQWPHLGIVLQAYLRDCERDAAALIKLLRERQAPITLRLVKGAYWDYETILARQHNWPVPVFTKKSETDANYERMLDLLLPHYPRLRLAVASHNIRSIAAALARVEQLGLPGDALELQMLYGMGDQLKHAVLEHGQRLRIYTPFGELLPGMAYLVRRLLENTANDSFLRQGFTEGVAREHLLRNPAEFTAVDEPPAPAGFRNIPERNYALVEHQHFMQEALRQVAGRFGQTYPLIIGGQPITTGREIVSTNPARPAEIVGQVASAGEAEAQLAVDAAHRALPAWRATPPGERANLLRRAADLVSEDRDRLAALEVYEVGKNWREADADICETIDYLRYYAAEMERLAGQQLLRPIPGEANDYGYEGKGVAVVIAPWNFPMAIFAGMTSAALVTGNTVIAKPAGQSVITAAAFTDCLQRAGLPPGVLNFLPGPGEKVGGFLVRHPRIHLIAFTGSREVGCQIYR
ncbi:MAG TPA: proline dehydrogenase family protein, partial [Armatimonadota bacterium]